MQAAARRATIEHDRRHKPTMAQRVGRAALGGIANGIIVVHSTKLLTKGTGAQIGKDTHAAVARRAEAVTPRLRQRLEARQSAEVGPSRLRRLGNLALSASVVVSEAITRRSSKRAARLDEKSASLQRDFTQKYGGGRLVAIARAYKEGRSEEKIRAQDRRRIAADDGVLKYREAHPEILEREHKVQQASAYHNILESLRCKRENDVDYFRSKNAYSFMKSIPRRPSSEGQPGFIGNYSELAKHTLASALTHTSKDGTVPLLGANLQRARLADHGKQGQSIRAASNAETHYADGVSTALWQLGFIQIEKETDVPYSRGRFNPSIEWENGDGSVKARLPYDPTNELHQMLVPAEGASAHQMIELIMPPKEYGYGQQQDQYLNMRIVESDSVPVAA